MQHIVGPKLRDGLLAFERQHIEGLYAGADEYLILQGYHPNVANDIIDRLARKGWIEYGVSARTGWLTDEGRHVLETVLDARE